MRIAAIVLVVVATGVAALAIGPLHLAVPLFLILAWFALPGVWLARRAYAPDRSSHVSNGDVSWLVGPIWGYGMCATALLACWCAGLRHPSALLLAPPLAWVALRALVRRGGWLSPPPLDRRDAAAVCLVMALVPAIVGRPFSQVGRETPDGIAYRAYFTADFVWAKAVVAEVAKADVPPVNPFLRETPLNYYWLPHLVSAAEYRANVSGLNVDRILLLNGLGLGVMFGAFLYGFVRHWIDAPGAALVACAFALGMSSFEGSYQLWDLWRAGADLGAVTGINIDGVSRWTFRSVVVDGLQRLLMYQVTHHAVGYATGLSALLVVTRAHRPAALPVAALAGTLLAVSLFFSSFSAIMIGAAVAICYSARVFAAGSWLRLPVLGAAAALPVTAAVMTSVGLHYVDRAGGFVTFGLNPVAARNAWAAVPLSFGPVLPGALLGLLAAARAGRSAVGSLVVLAAVCLAAYFCVDVPDHQSVYVAWRAGHVLIIVFATLLGIAWQRGWDLGGWRRGATVAVALVGGAFALPTTVIDIYNSQEISNRAMGPGFRWTVLLSRGEAEALEWIRTRTSPRTVVQSEPFVRGRDTWAYIPAFAERRMAAGLPISMVPLKKYEDASARVRAIYQATDPAAIYDAAAGLRIDYVMIGDPERAAYPAFEPTLRARPDLFVEDVATGAVSLFRLRGAPPPRYPSTQLR